MKNRMNTQFECLNFKQCDHDCSGYALGSLYTHCDVFDWRSNVNTLFLECKTLRLLSTLSFFSAHMHSSFQHEQFQLSQFSSKSVWIVRLSFPICSFFSWKTSKLLITESMASQVGPQIVHWTMSSVAGFNVSGGGIFVLPTSFLYKKSASVP